LNCCCTATAVTVTATAVTATAAAATAVTATLLPQPVVIDPALEALPLEDKQYLQQHAALRAVLLTMEDLHLSELSYPRQVTLMQQLHATRYVRLTTIDTAVSADAAVAYVHLHASALPL
jgi:fatty acid/phospholipid biosynthesis enzyme